MFEDLGGTLPLPTRVAMGISDILTSTYGVLVYAAMGRAVFGFLRWKNTENGRRIWGRISLRLPAKIGDVIQKVALARFARTLGTLSAAGVRGSRTPSKLGTFSTPFFSGEPLDQRQSMVGTSAVCRIIGLWLAGSSSGSIHSTKAKKVRRRTQMVSFNRVVLAGNLTRDPELRFTQNGVPVCSFSIAVNRVRSKSEAVDFFNVSAWRELGETVANYKKKGDPILVEGRLQYRTWEVQNGGKRSAVDVVADRVQFLSRGQNPRAEEAPVSAKVLAGTAASGGWGLAKQLQNGGDGGEATDSKEEDFENLPF